MAEKSIRPVIRFAGFTDAWEQRELGEIVKMVGGATPSKANRAYWDGDLVWLSSQEIKNRYVSEGTYTITEKAVRESATKVIPANTPLIVSRSGILARMFPITLPTVDVAINQDIKALFFEKDFLDTDFFVSQLEGKEKTILSDTVKTGTTVQSVNLPDFEKLIVSIPAKREQLQIGQMYKNFGNLITLHQRKHDKLVNIKKAMLRRMFPQDGASVPEVRFAGFSGTWEQHKLGELYTERNERGNDTLQILSVSIHNGVSCGELDSDTLGKQVRRSEDKSLYKHVYFGDLVLNMMRAWQGALGVVRTEGMVSPAYITAIPNEQVYPLFMDCCLSRDVIIAQMNNLSYGVTDFRKRLYWDSFVNVMCRIPSIPEQAKITSFFDHLDRLIALHQRKLEKLQNLKRACLEKMFV